MAKECVLSTGKLPLGGLLGNTVVRITDYLIISQGHNFHKLLFSTFKKYYILDDGGNVSVL